MFQSTLLRKTRILFVRTMIVVLTVTACFAGLEFVLHRYYSIQQGAWTSFDSMRGWRLVPGEYRYKPLGEVNNVAITINAFGLRSHSLSAPRLNTKNIVVLGDSNVFAFGTALEETFPDRLMRLLNDRVNAENVVDAATRPLTGRVIGFTMRREIETIAGPRERVVEDLMAAIANLLPDRIRPGLLHHHE